MDQNRLKKLMNAASMALFVLCVALGIWLWRKGVFQSKEALQDFLTNYGGSATTLFLVLQAVQVVIPILPGGVSCLAGVLIFGPWLGFVLNYVGISLGSFVAFAMARNWGKPLLNKLFSKKLHEKYERWTHESRRFDRLFALAIFLPGLPDDFLCFLAGTTGMSWKKFALITVTCRPLMIFAYSLGALGFRAVFPL
ncbi:MAG TPA: TVP38/TMEM64 family protein [Candidatus Avoscillospira avistercoris]|uniref:TVP38/TMEM64 family membrane protein n=1 Tax=Candidatus Avoscillospira avistercoris TaxID=2840707 RepID=A0A9D1JTJ8_9FIRM|nr:TVP38/TMEM64 family protein [Candidatus Avoscillospira avistercoris]